MHVKYQNLREWLTQIEAMGELRKVEGATAEEDAGMLAEMLAHTDDAPAVLMDDIPGYPKGNRLLINTNGARRRIAHTFGFDPDTGSSRFLAKGGIQ